MRVELSPWKNLDLSSLSGGRRRRKAAYASRSIGDFGHGENDTSETVALSFVACSQQSSSPPAKKSRRANSGTRVTVSPFAVVTSKSWIAVVEKKQAPDGSCSLVESEHLQYACRPGTSFYPREVELSVIPATFDEAHDRLYAVQRDNRHLLSWTSASTPDDTKCTSTFDAPLLSLATLENKYRSTVYGSLRDNKLFVAYADDDKAIVARVFHNDNLHENARHIGTFAQRRPIRASPGSMTRKRVHYQAMKDSSDEGICFVQLFATSVGLMIVKHETQGLRASDLDNIVTTHKSVVVGSRDQDVAAKIESARLLGVADDNRLAFVAARIQGLWRVVILSLETGSLLRSSYHLPTISNQTSVFNGVLSMCCGAELRLFDAQRGTLLASHSIHSTNPSPLLLKGSSDESCLVVAGKTKDDGLLLSMSNVKCTTRLRLADAIASAQGSGTLCTKNSVSGDLSKEEQQKSEEHARIDKASKMLRMAIKAIARSDSRDIGDDFLSEAFWQAAAAVRGIDDEKTQEFGIVNGRSARELGIQNGKNGVNGRTRQLNGLGDPVGASGKGLNKSKTFQNFPLQKLSVTFLNEAALEISNVVLSRGSGHSNNLRENALLILKVLVRTGKIKARSFPGSTVARLVKVMTQSLGYTGTAFVFDLFWCCGDLSEYQMIAGLHFLLSLEDPMNFAFFLNDNRGKFKLPSEILCAIDCLSSSAKTKPTNGNKIADSELAPMMLFVVSLLVKEVIGYSNLNGALLRKAMACLPRGEILFLVRFLPTVVPTTRASAVTTRRLFSIIAAVADSLQEQGEKPDVVAALQTTLKNELLSTQYLTSLKADLQNLAQAIPVKAHRPPEPDRVEDLYQIERLVL